MARRQPHKKRRPTTDRLLCICIDNLLFVSPSEDANNRPKPNQMNDEEYHGHIAKGQLNQRICLLKANHREKHQSHLHLVYALNWCNYPAESDQLPYRDQQLKLNYFAMKIAVSCTGCCFNVNYYGTPFIQLCIWFSGWQWNVVGFIPNWWFRYTIN